ncbi:MAG: GNAT family N-acetyltransferase [Microcella sp.]|uniref:GNAT family N-acetyltransferase n=1 Tax=Microcella sp. TaxID=1913979 RepID=UPI0024CDA4CA|nr:GNAT family N-acetyltransferase [Microcella sp.]UYN82641.1 MAG: GNAT family N-acetyltransferase [Microcella sp.]
MQPVTLRTARFVLSMPTLSDVDAVFAACQDAELQRFVPVPVPYERSHAEGFVLEFVPEWWRNDVEYVFGIRPAADAPLWGVVSWQRENRSVGYWLAKEHRGRRVMTEALSALADWVFGHEPTEHMQWEAVEGNIGSAIVAQRCGFRWQGLGRIENARPGQETRGWRATLTRLDHEAGARDDAWPVLA